jgi:nucleotide-binding universal stress UspA family protein
MDRVICKKTFLKILVAIHESSKSTDKAVDYATKIAQDYKAMLVVLYVIRAQANLETLNLPSHIVRFKKQAEDYLSKITEKIYRHSDSENIVRIV